MNIKDTYTTVFLKAAGQPFTEQTVKDLKGRWWCSTRDKEVGGLRITDECLKYIQDDANIKTYTIDLPRDLIIGPQVLIWLDNFLNSPFHLTKKNITVISEKTAFEIYLFSGDVKKMGSAKALNKRINQE